MENRCQFIYADGRRCGSISLRQEHFCYFHHTTRRPIQNPRERKGRRSTFDLPLIEDRASIQRAVSEILARIAHFVPKHDLTNHDTTK